MSNNNDFIEYHNESKITTGETIGIILLIGFFVFLFVIHIVSIVDVARHCKENQLVQLLLVLFVPFYAIIYFFIKKSVCPRKPIKKKQL
jgi:hypothetical protein